jgi:hypothetical protein
MPVINQLHYETAPGLAWYSERPLTAEDHAHSQTNSRGTYGGQSDSGTGGFLQVVVYPASILPPIPNTYFHLSMTDVIRS